MTPRFPSKHPAPPSPLLARRPSHKEDEQTGSTRPTTHRHAHPIGTDAIARALAHVAATEASTQPMHVQRPDTSGTQHPQQGIQHPDSPTSPARWSHEALRAAHTGGDLHLRRQCRVSILLHICGVFFNPYPPPGIRHGRRSRPSAPPGPVLGRRAARMHTGVRGGVLGV